MTLSKYIVNQVDLIFILVLNLLIVNCLDMIVFLIMKDIKVVIWLLIDVLENC